MKNALLLLIALAVVTVGYSQNKPVLKQDLRTNIAIKADRVGMELEKTKPIVTNSVNTPASYKSANDVNFVTVISIGTASNAYSYGYAGGQKAIVSANNDINTVSHVHRMGGTLDPGGYSGDLGIDISTDGGMTWSNMNEVYTSTISGGTYNTDAARYPNHGIWNPAGNTDPNNAYIAFWGATLDGTNGSGSWGGEAYGRAKIGALTTDTTKNLFTSVPPYYGYIPDAYDVSKDGIIIVCEPNQDWTSGTVVYESSLTVYRGVWDEGVEDFVFDRSLVDFPTVDGSRPVHVKFAFGPDGQTGYIGVITDNGSVTPLYDSSYYYPVFIKTSDGGQNWGDPVAVRLDGPDGLPGVLNYLRDTQIDSLFNPPVPARDEIAYTTAFDCDMAVDAWGNPHMSVVIGVGGSSAYSIVTASGYGGAFDVYSTDGGTTWDAVEMGPLTQFRGTFGTDYTEDNRIQITTTQDGRMVFVSWLDTQLEGATENTSPDIFCRGFSVVNANPAKWNLSKTDGGLDAPDNVTTFSEAMWQAYFCASSRFAFNDESFETFTIPFAYEALTTPFDPTLPVQYKYIQDFSFTAEDFLYVGVKENGNAKPISVSQNYPNPFGQDSRIDVTLPQASNLSLKVTNLVGQEVLNLNKGYVGAGSYSFTVDASKMQSGVYFYTVTAGENEVTKRMIVK
jgi:hypothetical protein